MSNHTQCELCASGSELATFEVPLIGASHFPNTAVLCATCRKHVEGAETVEGKRWHCLTESIWTENPAVKVLAWRILNGLSSETWAQDLLEQLDLEDELLEWAKAGGAQPGEPGEEASALVRDSNGTVLAAGDSVTLIKDLDVKGAGFTAKRGALVKNIALTADSGLIEGRVNGALIVLKTCFLKKAT